MAWTWWLDESRAKPRDNGKQRAGRLGQAGIKTTWTCPLDRSRAAKGPDLDGEEDRSAKGPDLDGEEDRSEKAPTLMEKSTGLQRAPTLMEKKTGPSSASHSGATAVTHCMYSLTVNTSSW